MEVVEFESWILKNLNVDLSAYKPAQLHRRIKSLMNRIGVDNYVAYTELIKRDEAEQKRFLNYITINVTEFFRNPQLFFELQKKIKEELLVNNRNLKIWSAACSQGAEPYSLAMIMKEISPHGRHEIIATDIDEPILDRAKEGKYAYSEIKNISEELLIKYFKKKNEEYYIEPIIKNMVAFHKHDLILDDYFKNMDLIVCRNVVIYFNSSIKNEIYKKFHSALKKGGLLFVGATESIYNYKELGLDKVGTFIYRKI
ncbi:CheR family methyltransferase [Alloiococcus sp. CFN-8]|uniref:CheR family methyltransferase n=1 Tax=Alloiococcus sp. CFN-8 TaxID=3416081 RepID=UPI003CFB3D12